MSSAEGGAGHAADLGRTEAYDYELPPGRIARYPTERRDRSRLLVVPGSPADDPHDLRFSDFPSLLRPGDLLVLNESRVLPLRLLGRKPTGARGEILLLRPAEAGRSVADAELWEALVRPGSKLKPGRELVISERLRVRIEDGAEAGGRIVRLVTDRPIDEALREDGHVPLPPYLDRSDEPLDRERYQTVYARDPGSVAAPTAGLHFTTELLEALVRKGVEIARVSLHVGPGTFRPVEAEAIAKHRMHHELWRVPPETVRALDATRFRGGRIWAVGTTVVRTLESAADEGGRVRAGRGETNLFISPGYRFRVVDALVTNFHLPRSTLLMLVAAFAGYENTMRAYRHAVRSEYRFYSYGDAMVIPPRESKELTDPSESGLGSRTTTPEPSGSGGEGNR